MNVETDDPKWEEYVLRKHKEYFDLASSFIKCADDLLDKFSEKSIREDDLSLDGFVISFLFAKGYKSTKAALRLCKNGYPEDAFILARVNFEAALWALNIADDKKSAKEKAQAYIGYDQIDLKERLDKIIEFYNDDPKSKAKFIEILKRMEEKIPKTQKEQKKICKFARKKVFELAKDVRLTHLLYRTFYWDSSNYAHSKYRSSKSYVTQSNGNIKFLLVPTERELRNVLIHLCLFLWYLMDRFNYLFELGFEKILT